MRKKSGFTLIEILVVIALMAILSIMAISSSITIQRYFSFKGTYNYVLNQIQKTRLYAATQQTALNPATSMNEVPLNYSTELLGTTTPNGLFVYAKFGATTGKYVATEDTLIDQYSYDPNTYEMMIFSGNESDTPAQISSPVNLTYYSPGSGAANTNDLYFSGEYGPTNTDIATDYIIIRMRNKTQKDLYKCIVILTNSGMIEPMEKDSPLMSKTTCPIPT